VINWLTKKGKDRVGAALLDREIIYVFPVDLGLVGVGYVLFLGRSLLLIWCVRIGLVLPKVTNKLGVDTNRASTGAHDVLGERPCPISTDGGWVGHGLAGAEDANEEIFRRSHTPQ
jgi:hypothetical protein